MTALDPRALDALKNNQRQLDMDGCEVGVSRQALDELLTAYEALSQPQAGEPVEKPYAYEFGRSNGDDTYSVVIERSLPAKPHPDWPVKPLYASPPPANPAQVTELIEEAKDFAERMTGQPWACELVEKLIDAFTAAIGAGSAEPSLLDRERAAMDVTQRRAIEGERISDAVLAWMVKYDLLDAGNEYHVSDVLAVLDDLAPSDRSAAIGAPCGLMS